MTRTASTPESLGALTPIASLVRLWPDPAGPGSYWSAIPLAATGDANRTSRLLLAGVAGSRDIEAHAGGVPAS